MLRVGETILSSVELANCFSTTKCSAVKTYTQVILRKLGGIDLGICVYTYTYVFIAIKNQTESMNLKESREGYMGDFGGKKWKGNYVIKL